MEIISNKQMQLPHDSDVEAAVLGAAFLSNDAFDAVIEGLTASDFYEEAHKNIYLSLVDYSIKNVGISVDIVSFKNFLTTINKINACGGMEYITSIIDNAPDAINIDNYIRIIKDYALRRNVIEVNRWTSARAYDLNDELDSLIDDASAKILDLSIKSSERNKPINIKNFLKNYTAELEERINNRVRNLGIETGFPIIDSKTQGFRPGQFIIVSGRPGTGKTAFALSCMLNMIKEEFVQKLKDEDGNYIEDKHYIRPAFFSFEMGVEEILQRMLASVSHVSHRDIQTNNILPDGPEHENLIDAIEKLSKKDFYFIEAAGMNLSEVKTQARKLKKEGLDIIFIDYLSLINTDNLSTRMQSWEKMAHVSRNLKTLARELQIPIVALAQLGRDAESETPTMANIRDSGAIEQDADTIILLVDPLRANRQQGDSDKQEAGKEDKSDTNGSENLYPEKNYEEFYNDTSTSRKIKRITAILAKQRSGETGAGDLCFLPEIVTFCNYERRIEKNK